ncbi:MAG: hypothetical protein QOD74_943 [Variibacter sp.]|nr:hypothetical protein [Variibacter sp.]
MAHSVVRSSIMSVSAGGLTLFAGLICGVVLARVLGAQGMGKVVFAGWIVAVAVVVADLGLPAALIRYMPELIATGHSESGLLAPALLRPFTRSAILGTCLFLLAALALFLFGHKQLAALALAAALLFVLQAYSQFATCEIRGRQQFPELTRLAGVSGVLQVAGVSFGAYYFGPEGALTGYAAGHLVPALQCLRLIRRNASVPSDLALRLSGYARHSWLAAGIDQLVWARLETFFLAQFLGPEAVAIFAVGLTLSNLPTQLPIHLSGPLLPLLASRLSQQGNPGVEGTYRSALSLFAFIIMPVSLGGAAVLPALVPILYGSSFSAAVPVAMILVAGSWLSGLTQVPSALIFGLERGSFFVRAGLFGGALIIAAGLLIVPIYGATGAAWSRIIVHGMIAAWSILFLAQLGFKVSAKPFLRIAAASLASAAAAHIVLQFWGNTIPALAAAVCAGAFVYFAAVKLFPPLRAIDLEPLRRSLENLPGPFARATWRVARQFSH